MEFKSRSQAGQDRFAFEVLGRPEVGTFLDIGANNPIEINNSYALERLGWLGLLVDNSPESQFACRDKRVSPFMLADATKIDWDKCFFENRWATNGFPSHIVPFRYDIGGPEIATVVIDYLSLDVDEATLQTLQNMPLDQIRFKAITIEHDAYRFGLDRRDQIIELLVKHGYDVLCSDVCDQGLSFEAWAVDPTRVDERLADSFRRLEPTDWKMVKRLGT